MNLLPPDKVCDILECLWNGHSVRETARLVGCSKVTVGRYRKAVQHVRQASAEEWLCGCGRLPAGHKGMCNWRKARARNRGRDGSSSPTTGAELEAVLNRMAHQGTVIRVYEDGKAMYRMAEHPVLPQRPPPHTALEFHCEAGYFRLPVRDGEGRFLPLAHPEPGGQDEPEPEPDEPSDILQGISGVSAASMPLND